MRTPVLSPLFSVVLLAAPAFAQEPAGRIPPRVVERVTVTAHRVEESTDTVGSSVTVLTRADLEASGAVWLFEALDGVAGVTVARSGGPGNATSVFLRGANSNHTLVLVDGLEANSPALGAYSPTLLPVSWIDRIEIVRGPQSTLYGSEAIGGVINIVTRRGAARGAGDVSIEAGAFGTVRTAASARGRWGAVDYALGADVFRSDGFSAAEAARGNVESDRFDNTAVDARLRWAPTAQWAVESWLRRADGATRIDGFDFAAGPADDLHARNDATETFAAVRATFEHDAYRAEVTISSTDQRLVALDPNGFTPRREVDGRVREIDLQGSVAHSATRSSLVGVELRSVSSRSLGISSFGTSGFDENIAEVGLFAQHRLRWTSSGVSVGVRLEDHSRFGTRATYQTTAFANVAGVRWHGSLGSAFRAPNFNELYFPNFGNQQLAAESSSGYDVGATLQTASGRLRLDATYFRNDIDELIEFTFPAGFVNVGQVVSQGLELSSSLQPWTGWSLDGTYTYTDARAQGGDEQLLRRPRHQGSIALRVEPNARLMLRARLLAKGERNDFGLVGTVSVDGFRRLDLNASYRLRDDVQISLRLDNVADAEYQEVWGFGTAGRSAFLGLRYAWARS